MPANNVIFNNVIMPAFAPQQIAASGTNAIYYGTPVDTVGAKFDATTYNADASPSSGTMGVLAGANDAVLHITFAAAGAAPSALAVSIVESDVGTLTSGSLDSSSTVLSYTDGALAAAALPTTTEGRMVAIPVPLTGRKRYLQALVKATTPLSGTINFAGVWVGSRLPVSVALSVPANMGAAYNPDIASGATTPLYNQSITSLL